MEINELKKRATIEQNSKLNRKFVQLEKLLEELKAKKISAEVINTINEQIEAVNSSEEKGLSKQIWKAQTQIIKLIEKELKLVTINYYRNSWLAVGMSIGVAMGVALGVSGENMGLLALGLPIGLGIGIAIGTAMDKKAKANGLQLELEIKY